MAHRIRRSRSRARRFLASLAILGIAALTPPTSVGAAVLPTVEPPLVQARLLGFNDFHGNIDPPVGSSGLVNGAPAGGVEYLATAVKRLRVEAQARGEKVYTVAAGDLINASPLVSSEFRDEPSITALSELGLDFSSVGNHEFDRGVPELLRLQRGGCPGGMEYCPPADRFPGAGFAYLAANVVSKTSHLPILRPYEIREIGGVKVGFVGLTLKGTGELVDPDGVRSVEFLDEIETANHYADLLTAKGVKALVLLLHEGGAQRVTSPQVQDPSGCDGFSGALTPIVRGLRSAYGVVLSGHTHQSYICRLPNRDGVSTLVTSAGSFGTLVTDVSVSLNPRTGRFASASARNVVVANGVPLPGGGWRRDDHGQFLRNTALIDPAVKKIVDPYRKRVAPIAERVVGRVTADLSNVGNTAGESPLGDIVAEAQRTYPAAGAAADLALMNPGGIRTSLVYRGDAAPAKAGAVTYADCSTVQPFRNQLVTVTLTGAQLRQVLEQQFLEADPENTERILQVSQGFWFSYDLRRSVGDRIVEMKLGGVGIDPDRPYRVRVNSFLVGGGDGFSALTQATDRVTAPGFDIDALLAHLEAVSPLTPGPLDRISRLG
jgi:5'-nucleotidase